MDTYAVVKVGGKQEIIEQGSRIVTEKLEVPVNQDIVLNEVLFLRNGEDIKVGTPLVNGASVVAQVTRQFRGPKIIVFKKRSKKGYKKTQGHRQYLTELKIKEIKV